MHASATEQPGGTLTGHVCAVVHWDVDWRLPVAARAAERFGPRSSLWIHQAAQVQPGRCVRPVEACQHSVRQAPCRGNAAPDTALEYHAA